MARTRLATRSQSRELSTEPLPPRTRTRSRQASVEGEGQAENILERNTQQNHQLETLPEDEDEAEDVVHPHSDDGSVALSNELSKRNDTPSQPSHSQTELEELKPDEMVENLSDLSHEATQLLSHYKISTADAAELRSMLREIKDINTKRRQRIDSRWNNLEPLMDVFGKMAFLDCDIVLRSLLKVDSTAGLPNKPWRPDDIIYKANLTKFLYQTTGQDRTHPEMGNWIEAWNQNFPTCFALDFRAPGKQARIGHSELTKQTLVLGLELRTQFIISALQQQEELTIELVDQTLHDIMLVDNSDEHLVEALAVPANVRGWELLPPPQHFVAGDMSFAELVASRTRNIREILLYTGQDSFDLNIGLQSLLEKFSWEEFQLYSMQWAKLRISEIDQSIKRQGGVDMIRESLEDVRERGVDFLEASEIVEDASERLFVSNNVTPARTNTSSKVGAGPAALRRIMASFKPSSKGRSISSAMLEEQRSVGANHTAPSEELNEVTTEYAQSSLPARRTQGANVHRSVPEGPAASRAPKRSIYDSQPDGVRIPFDDDQEIPPEPVSQRGGFRRPNYQQAQHVQPSVEVPTQQSDIDDPSEDEGFQNDNRNIPAPNRRPRSPRMEEPSEDPIDDLTPTAQPQTFQRTIAELPPSPKRQRKNPGQSIDPYIASGKPLADLAAQAVHEAKIKGREKMYSKPSRTRNPWTTDEVQRLSELIEEHGTSWARLKTMDESEEDVLHMRTAEDLRFKARVIKVNLMKSHMELPANFDRIILGRKEREDLKRHGVPDDDYQRVRGGRDDISD